MVSKQGSSSRDTTSTRKTKNNKTTSLAATNKGRYSSAASLASALNLKRKTAFDDTSMAILDNTNSEDNITFITSTTDHLEDRKQHPQQGNRRNTAQNLHGSFDSQETPISAQPDIVSAGSSMGSPKLNPKTARERKRQQERQWELDRLKQQKKKSAKRLSKSSAKLVGINTQQSSALGLEVIADQEDSDDYDDFDDDDDYEGDADDYEDNEDESFSEKRKPSSSRQLGRHSSKILQTARNGYDSDSYSLKVSRSRVKSKLHKPNRHSLALQESRGGESSLFTGPKPKPDPSCASPTSERYQSGQDSQADNSSYMLESQYKIKMTKMEKIKQLQEKNERYKQEYKKTYLEKKEYKKKYEDKKMEVASLTSEVEAFMKETALLKKQLAKQEHEQHPSKTDAKQLTKAHAELEDVRSELKAALEKLEDRKLEIESLKEMLKRKDEQIESLTLEVSQQIEEVQNLQEQLQDEGTISRKDRKRSDPDEGLEEKLAFLEDENNEVKAELKMTLKRAAEMVKSRETSIELLKKENKGLKELLELKEQDDDKSTTSEKLRTKEGAIEQLRVELTGLREMLEDSAIEKDGLKNKIQVREKELFDMKVEMDGLKRMVKRAEKEAHRAKMEVEERDNTITSLHGEIAVLENQNKEIELERGQTNELAESRTVELRELKNEYKLLQEKKQGSAKDLDEARKELKCKDDEVKLLFRENETLKAEMMQQKNDLDERRKTLVLELEDIKLNEKELLEQVEESETMIKARDEAIEDLLKEVERLKTNQHSHESNHVQEMNKHEENLLTMMKETEDLKRQLKQKNDELEHARGMVKEREIAIEDLLRDIEAVKQEATHMEQEGSTRLTDMKKKLYDQNKKIDKLTKDFEKTSRSLAEAEKSLKFKTESLRECEETVEDLVKDMEELKRQYESNASDMKEKALSTPRATELEEELENAIKVVREKDEKLKQVIRENIRLNNQLEKLDEDKAKDDDGGGDDDSEAEDTKSFLKAQQEVMEEEIQQLTDQVTELQEELADAHRQNSILNEEIEDWVQRGGNFELEIQRLKNDVEEWEDKAARVLGNDYDDDDADGQSVGGHSTGELGDKQAKLLQKAMAERQRKNKSGDGSGVWGLFFNKSEEAEDLTEDQKRIKELEAIKDAQAEEIQKIKSDLVKQTTAARNEAYVSKKRIADLEKENEGYKAKVELLLRRLKVTEGISLDDDDGTVATEEKKVDAP